MNLNIERVAGLLLIAAIVSMFARRLRLPYTVGLTLAGLALPFCFPDLDVQLTKDLIFSAFLPPLIFEAAFQMSWRELRDDLPVILILATFGVLVAALLTACGLFFVAGWSLPAALLLGVLISATDPVSVLATFKEARVQGRLRLLVEAESLFNDGTVAVFFGVALAALGGHGSGLREVLQGFLAMVLGGVLCGAAVGGAALAFIGRTDDHLVEITFSTVAAYGSFLLAEHFGLSGVLATLTAGVLMGNIRPTGALSSRGHAAVVDFWEYIGFAANSLIFLLIGMRLTHHDFAAVWHSALLAIVLVLLGRALAVYGCCLLFAKSSWRVSLNHQHILVWGGLRGALALALASGLPQSLPQRELVVTTAFAVVAFSVLIQGATMTPLLRKLGEVTGEVAPRKGEEIS